jgi:hypothetical protein
MNHLKIVTNAFAAGLWDFTSGIQYRLRVVILLATLCVFILQTGACCWSVLFSDMCCD